MSSGSVGEQGPPGARPQDQVQLALHRQGEVPLRQEELPRRLTRHQTVNLTLYVITGMANFFWKLYVVHKAFETTTRYSVNVSSVGFNIHIQPLIHLCMRHHKIMNDENQN